MLSGVGIEGRLLHLERALADRDVGAAGGDLLTLLADDFLEIGRSGTVWTKDSIAPLLERRSPQPLPPFEDFRAERLAPGLYLVTYRGAMAIRSSIWVRRDDRWQMRFHQGTSIPTDEPTGASA